MLRRLSLAAAGVMLLLGSLSLNVYLYDLALGYYRDLNAARLDPLALAAFPSPTPGASAQPLVVFFGDSRAQDWPIPQGIDGAAFVNRGVGNQTSTQVALRFDAHVRPLQPDVIIVQVCINDLKTIPLFAQREVAIIGGCKRSLDTIIAGARDISAVVILTTVFPVGEPPLQRRPVWSDAIGPAIETVNDYIRSLAAADVVIFDAYALLVDQDGRLRLDLRADELHLNAAGYALLNAALADILQPVLQSAA